MSRSGYKVEKVLYDSRALSMRLDNLRDSNL